MHNGIIICSDGTIQNIEYIYSNSDIHDNDTYGKIVYRLPNGDVKSIKYLNMVNIMQNLKDSNKDDDQFEKQFSAKIEEKN